MDQLAIDELRLCHAALLVENVDSSKRGRRLKAEAMQRALWANRDAIVQMAMERETLLAEIRDLGRALRPFGRCALLLPGNENPVLLSLAVPGAARCDFVQLRARDFRRAHELTQGLTL